MHLYLTCEFNGTGSELVSMALASEDMREWYEALACHQPTPWVRDHVIPRAATTPLVNERVLHASLWRFLHGFRELHVLARWPREIARFYNALVVAPGVTVAMPPITVTLHQYPAPCALSHNALLDARRFRDAAVPAPQPQPKGIPT